VLASSSATSKASSGAPFTSSSTEPAMVKLKKRSRGLTTNTWFEAGLAGGDFLQGSCGLQRNLHCPVWPSRCLPACRWHAEIAVSEFFVAVTANWGDQRAEVGFHVEAAVAAACAGGPRKARPKPPRGSRGSCDGVLPLSWVLMLAISVLTPLMSCCIRASSSALGMRRTPAVRVVAM